MNKPLLTATSIILLLSSCAVQSKPEIVIQNEPARLHVHAWNEPTFTKPSDDVLKKTLSPMEYDVTQHDGTEPPFHNEYWDNEKAGIYVDIVSGEPLFSSLDKFDSGTGWPSFTKPLEPNNIVERSDNALLFSRTEIRSKHADSHLGHVFTDGPPPTHLRYCMNSAALLFIPKDQLKARGYGQYLKLFSDVKP